MLLGAGIPRRDTTADLPSGDARRWRAGSGGVRDAADFHRLRRFLHHCRRLSFTFDLIPRNLSVWDWRQRLHPSSKEKKIMPDPFPISETPACKQMKIGHLAELVEQLLNKGRQDLERTLYILEMTPARSDPHQRGLHASKDLPPTDSIRSNSNRF